jgi:hypothetical protein
MIGKKIPNGKDFLLPAGILKKHRTINPGRNMCGPVDAFSVMVYVGRFQNKLEGE